MSRRTPRLASPLLGMDRKHSGTYSSYALKPNYSFLADPSFRSIRSRRQEIRWLEDRLREVDSRLRVRRHARRVIPALPIRPRLREDRRPLIPIAADSLG
jgi:hypothetical protein